MPLETITDQTLVTAVHTTLETSPYKQYISTIVDRLQGRKCYLVGGMVRDAIVNAQHHCSLSPTDVDILIDDGDGTFRLGNTFYGREITINRFGTVKWRPQKELEIDISIFSNANALRQGQKKLCSLETSLTSCDFTTSSLAYDLNTTTLYNYRALEDIRKKTVDLLFESADEPSVLMARLILHAEKLQFSLGPNAISFIANSYTPLHDTIIAHYLSYKNKSSELDFVVSELRWVCQNKDK